MPATASGADANEKLPWLTIAAVFVVSRALVLSAVFISCNKHLVDAFIRTYLFLTGTPMLPTTRAVMDVPPGDPLSILWPMLWRLCQLFDGWQYRGIAEHGYATQVVWQGLPNVAFYPGFPVLLRFIAEVPFEFKVPVEPAIYGTGMVLNNLFMLSALFLLYKLVRLHSSSQVAISTVVLLALYPGSIFCSSFLTESQYLLLIVLFFWFLDTGKASKAAWIALPLNLTRLNGITVIPVFIENQWKRWRTWDFWLNLLLLGAEVIIFPLYLAIRFHDPFIYIRVQSVNRGSAPIGKWIVFAAVYIVSLSLSYAYRHDWGTRSKTVRRSIQGLVIAAAVLILGSYGLQLIGPPSIALECEQIWWRVVSFLFLGGIEWQQHIASVAALVASVAAFGMFGYKLPRSYHLYLLINLMIVLNARHYYSGLRYMTTLFPVFWCVASGLENSPRAIRVAAYTLSSLALLLFSVLYICSPDDKFLF